jgi:hypothetical protein
MSDAITDQEINKRIAEFMGWKNLEWCKSSSNLGITLTAGWYGESPIGSGHLTSDYTHSVDDLIPVIEKLRNEGVYIEIATTGHKSYSVDLYDRRDKLLSKGQANSMAMAICHAVMTFLGEE